MAAAIKALNAKIRSNSWTDYFCSTHFWGPASNFGIPIAAVMDAQKDPQIISGQMTAALTLYSGTFMRYSMAVTPKNYLLFFCHFMNFNSQVIQGYRWYSYHYMGGKEKSLAAQAEAAEQDAKSSASNVVAQAKDAAEKAAAKVKSG